MKIKTCLYLAIFLLISCISSAQLSRSVPASLTGVWYLSNSFPSTNDSLVYSRTSKYQHNWGYRLEFHGSNGFVDAYSGKCGNDDAIHNDKGIWHVSNSILTTSIPMSSDQATKHVIVRLTETDLVLRKLN